MILISFTDQLKSIVITDNEVDFFLLAICKEKPLALSLFHERVSVKKPIFDQNFPMKCAQSTNSEIEQSSVM